MPANKFHILYKPNKYKILSLIFFIDAGINLLVFSMYLIPISKAATASDTVQVNVTIGSTISISSPADVNLGSTTGTGDTGPSGGSASWTVTTNNSTGYKLEWSTDTAEMSSGSDVINAYSPGSADTPEAWSVDAADAEWGARLSSASTDANTSEWGTDGDDEKWLNVATSPREIVTRNSETAGSTETVYFRVQVGANHTLPTGTYSTNVTMTATTL